MMEDTRRGIEQRSQEEQEAPITFGQWCAQGARRMLDTDAARHGASHVEHALDRMERTALSLSEGQQRGLWRLLRALDRHGGALLADATGMGKTRVALAALVWWLLREDRSPEEANDGYAFICVPARLKSVWEGLLWRASPRAMRQGKIVVASHHALSLHGEEAWPHTASLPEFVIVDEAHRFRSTKTRRYDALARCTRRARHVLLLTASPICHGPRDLEALVLLFWGNARASSLRQGEAGWWRCLGRRAARERGAQLLDEAILEGLFGEVIVRRVGSLEGDDSLKRPGQRVERMRYDAGEHEQAIWSGLEREVRSLSLALFEDRWGMGLFVELMWRRWESGAGALVETLSRLILCHERALECFARRGEFVQIQELKSIFDMRSSQELLPFVVDAMIDTSSEEQVARTPIDAAKVRADLRRLEALRERAKRAMGEMMGVARTDRRGLFGVLCERIEGAWRAEKVLCFTSSAEGAQCFYEALCAQLASETQVGLLTGNVSKIRGLARCDAREVLARFSPRAQGEEVRYGDASQQVRVLIATDCIAHGENLQDCGRVVLLDFPHSPHGLVQRIGRLTRPGSAHDEVKVVWLRPTSWQDSLGMRHRLSHKAALASQAQVGYEEELGGLLGDLSDRSQLQMRDQQEQGSRIWRGFARHEMFVRERGADVAQREMGRIHRLRGVRHPGFVLLREGSEQVGWRYMWRKIVWGTKGEIVGLDGAVWSWIAELEEVASREDVVLERVEDAQEVRALETSLDHITSTLQQELVSIAQAPVNLCERRQLALDLLEQSAHEDGVEEVIDRLLAEEFNEGTMRTIDTIVHALDRSEEQRARALVEELRREDGLVSEQTRAQGDVARLEWVSVVCGDCIHADSSARW